MKRKLEKKEFNFIYRITNIINGYVYIGVHSTNNIEDGYMGSGTYLKNAIKKYGVDNFKREIIEYHEDNITAYNREKEIVNYDFVHKKDTYNLITGGFGGAKPDKYVQQKYAEYKGVKSEEIYSKSKKIRELEIICEPFEKSNENIFYNISSIKNPLYRPFLETAIMCLGTKDSRYWIKYKLAEFLCEQWHIIPEILTNMINNKFTQKKGLEILNKYLRYKGIKECLRIEKQEWIQEIKLKVA